MKFISAERIHDGNRFLESDTVLAIDKNHTIVDVIKKKDTDENNIIFYEGILCPGFVNAHCHLELSYLKNKMSEGRGLDVFIRELEENKKVSEEIIQDAIVQADKEMYESGIVAVGDISNTNSTFELKSKSKIHYHTFLEVYAFDPTSAETAFLSAKKLEEEILQRCPEKKIGCSIVPHAPYSVSSELFHLISENAIKNHGVISIHMQENEEENLLFREKKGKILDRLKSFGINTDNFSPTGKSSLESTLPQLPNDNHLLLVHNTFTSSEEIIFTTNTKPNAFYCFCLRANHFIEGKQPDLNLFSHLCNKICLGTDSYASNYSLKILDEIHFALKNSPFTLEQLLRFACINGSKALNIDNKFGSFEIGKSPGIVLISEEKNSKKLNSSLLFS